MGNNNSWLEEVAKEVYKECNNMGGGIEPNIAFTPPPAINVPMISQSPSGDSMAPEVQIAFDRPMPFANQQPTIIPGQVDQTVTQIDTPKPDEKSEEKESKTENITKAVSFLMGNPTADDAQIHEVAKQIGMDSHDFEEIIYKISGTFLSLGKSKDFKGEYDAKELAAGIKVEQEHLEGSSLPQKVLDIIAEKIAKDHLAEIKDYYTRLGKMEDKAPKVDEKKEEEKKD